MTWNATTGRYILDMRIPAAPGDHVKVTSSRGGVDYYYFNGGSNVPPVANNQSVTVLTGTPKAIILTATDVNGDPLTYEVVNAPTHGTLSGTAPNLTYAPNAGYEGPDSFGFLANDGQIDSNVATVAITVSASAAEEVVILLAEYKTKDTAADDPGDLEPPARSHHGGRRLRGHDLRRGLSPVRVLQEDFDRTRRHGHGPLERGGTASGAVTVK
ncbi:MAG: Ig-like domain-containing protein [Candidatus Moduliflexus flocculans]|nr:Ig-like domain-containing protein [Candidatus Moduliflexus flocculans]